jgi:primosomal protein N' (replication factor Y)
MDEKTKYYIDLVLPLKLWKNYTYEVTREEFDFLEKGMRVAVEFGKQKIQTGIVFKKHHKKPLHYETKPILHIVDNKPIINLKQWKLFEFISSYYLTPLGIVLKAALPGAFMLESDTYIIANDEFLKTIEKELNEEEFLIMEALELKRMINIKELSKIIPHKKLLKTINRLIKKNYIKTLQELKEKYKPKTEIFIQLHEKWNRAELNDLLENLHNKAPKQKILLLKFLSIQRQGKPVSKKKLLKESGAGTSSLKSLIQKGIFYEIETSIDRILFEKAKQNPQKLSSIQKTKKTEIEKIFNTQKPVLFHGVTSSGKTEIYIHLIEKSLKKNKQVLYLVPEIALTTQLVQRLVKIFGNKIAVYHSKYSQQERREVWMKVLEKSPDAQLILAARSGIFLPFNELDLIIVDEEHENSYKQQQPAPRYHARDMAIALHKIHHASILLGSATPAIESYYNCEKKKYVLLELKERYGKVALPEIKIIDLREAHRRKKMKAYFSEEVLKEIETTLKQKKQVIVFQNRRGFAPVAQCSDCGHVMECPHCDVSLTLHKHSNKLKCHYCGYQIEKPIVCPACGNPSITYKGIGTEQIQQDLQSFFPDYQIERLDSDTTKNKNAFSTILTRFQQFETDILVGTQMLVKGLDFEHVGLVVVMNADQLLYFPDFRADERSFQMLMQVAGRAGRKKDRGKVMIQTFNPSHPILQLVLEGNYKKMYEQQIQLRKEFFYPPFSKMINIIVKDRNIEKATEASQWLKQSFDHYFSLVLGPSDGLIPRIRDRYIKEILIKLVPGKNIHQEKLKILHVLNSFENIPYFKTVKITVDVDPY